MMVPRTAVVILLVAAMIMPSLVWTCPQGAQASQTSSRANYARVYAFNDVTHYNPVTFSDVPGQVYLLLIYNGGNATFVDSRPVFVRDELSSGSGFEIVLIETDVNSNNFTGVLNLSTTADPSKNQLGVTQGSMVNISFSGRMTPLPMKRTCGAIFWNKTFLLILVLRRRSL